MTLGSILAVASLLADMEHELPSASADALGYRLALARAIVTTTGDAWERRQLRKLARYESAFREDIGRCRVLGAAGDRGPWQVVPRSDAERARLCVSLEGDAELALERVHESVGACRWLPPEERLAVYARGACLSAEGRRLSRERWSE